MNVYVDHKQVYGMSCTIGNETTGDDEHAGFCTVEQNSTS